jgi:hypothetical protein
LVVVGGGGGGGRGENACNLVYTLMVVLSTINGFNKSVTNIVICQTKICCHQ